MEGEVVNKAISAFNLVEVEARLGKIMKIMKILEIIKIMKIMKNRIFFLNEKYENF